MKMKLEVRHASAATKFRLLMWKNFLQQWRHRLQTIAELLLPVLTMTLVLILRWQISPSQWGTFTYPPIPASSLNLSAYVLRGLNVSELAIAYSPDSVVLDDVMRSAVTNLLIQNTKGQLPIFIGKLPGFPIEELPPNFMDLNSTAIIDYVKSRIRLVPYKNSTLIRGIYIDEETTRKVIAAVEFDDKLYGARELSNNLSYSLRFPERPRLNSFYQTGGRTWRTDLIFPMFEMAGPRFPYSWEGGNDPGYVNEMFVALQQVISTELISRVTGLNLTSFKVNIQRFPHPPFVEDKAVDLLQFMFPMFIMLSFSYTAVNIARAIAVEKELQLKETMKIMGLPTWLHWLAWFCKQFIFLLLTAILTVVLLKVNWFTNETGFSEYAVFTNTSWTVLLFFMVLYLSCTIFFAFMISSIFSTGTTAALFTAVAWFLTYIPAYLLAMDVSMSTAVQVVTCFSLNSAMSYGFQLMLAKESSGGLQWGDFMSSPETETTRFVFGHVVLMMVADCVLYMLATLYLEQVLPGPYGTPKSWYFPFQLRFWCPNYKSDSGFLLENEKSEFEDIIIEKEPTDRAIGVKMHNLTKIFGNNTAVNNLSLNIYDDQITVLLGHNGAGKSTTISMMTGNLKVTHGSVSVAGFDMTTQGSAARSNIGLCPQHNVLFNELTVKEHLEFFARLKGFKGKELNHEIDELIEKLELQEKRNYLSKSLSGGQKRRLCVGIAFSGAARVVLLDEPTSGMDPSSRRALWELLQKEKKGRSMIMTTHFMDEADILGDRVAILAHGRLQCVGSPYFLKRHYGVGYTLVIVKDDDFDCHECTILINNYIPGTIVKEDRGTEITYNLINDYSHTFEEMLIDLERNIDKIKFKNYGLVATTLEDVFMSVGSDLSPVITESDDAVTTTTDSTIDDTLKNELDSSLEELDRVESSVTGFRLLCQQVLAVWMKQWLVLIRSPWLMMLQFVTPIVHMNTTLGVLKYVLSLTPTIRARLLMLTEGYASTETLLSFNGTLTTSLGALAANAYEMMFTTSDVPNMDLTDIGSIPVEKYYLNRTDDTAALGVLRHRMLIGSTFEDNSATAWFSNFGYHDVATSLAAIHSAILRTRNSTAVLNVYNHPLKATYTDQSDMQMMITMLSMQLSSGVGSSVSIITAVFIIFYIKERMSGAKLLQNAAGVQPAVLWGSAAVFNWAWFLITCVSIVVSCVAFDVIGLSTVQELGRMYLVIMLYGAAILPLTYLTSLVFKGPAIGFVAFYFLNVISGMMGVQVVEALSNPELDTQEVAKILDNLLLFFPLYSLVTAIRFLNQIGLREHTCLQGCEYLQAVYPNLECNMENLCIQLPDICCIRENPFFDWEEPGIMRYLLSMCFSCVLFWFILMTIEYRLLHKLFTWKKTPPPLDESTLDEDVQREAERARRVPPSRRVEHALLANGLAKYYGKHLAVDQVSLSVSDGECFGLLGVNGAGKTTTFKMLMGDESISSGEAYVSGYSVQRNFDKVHENIGYCPQFDALFGELTGRETMHMFALMRGLRMRAAAPTADTLAHALGFTKHLDKKVHQYSGGTKRKLNTAIAFMGRTRLVFVDEPTTGVDPAAKRHVWRATRGVQRAGRGVVLTSHSMEECEALCSRLTIMVNGRFQCLGTPQHLKIKFSEVDARHNSYGTVELIEKYQENASTIKVPASGKTILKGFTLIIKMKLEERDGETASIRSSCSVTDSIKEYVSNNFESPRIMEEYEGLLTYYLPDRSTAWSRMFGIMERAKRDLEIEDYSISQTTLEQIFLQFTKYQRSEGVTL